jgi:hypothetical protein
MLYASIAMLNVIMLSSVMLSHMRVLSLSVIMTSIIKLNAAILFVTLIAIRPSVIILNVVAPIITAHMQQSPLIDYLNNLVQNLTTAKSYKPFFDVINGKNTVIYSNIGIIYANI